jgi:His/Glu/Gln/Arg/opine family amino acid ABC transporter permease subunit
VFDFKIIVDSVPFLLRGALYTVQVSVLAIVAGLILGGMFGLASVSGIRALRAVTWCYVYFIRGTPLLVQIFLIYFGLAALGLTLPAFWSGSSRWVSTPGASRRRSSAQASSRSTAARRRPRGRSACRAGRRCSSSWCRRPFAA